MATASRNVVFGGATTVDHFLARPDHSVDWILWSDEASAVMADYWKSFDTILMGRKTYEVARARGRGTATPGMTTYVFSRTLKDVEHGVHLIADDAGAFVRRLKTLDGKDICVMGGGELAQALLDADVVDEIGMNIHPVLLGAGVPLFRQMRKQIDLELKACKAFTNGCVLVTYRVKH